MDFRPTEEQEILRRTVREFAEAEIGPHVMEWDEAQHFPPDLLPKLAALGLMGIQFAEEYGGAAMSAVDYCICIEELARVDPAIALSVAAHNGLCTAHINMFGSEAQKAAYLPRLVKGEVLGAWGLTEASAGSDAAGMRTAATRQGDGWVINGAKTFITHGAIGGVMVVMAVTDRAKGHRGISAFVLEHGTPGMRAGKKENKLGMRASDTSEVIFEDCRCRRRSCSARKGRASSTRCRCSTPGASALRRCRSAWRRARTRRRDGTRRSAISSGSRSPRSRRSSGSSPTPPRRSKRRGC